MKKYLDNRTGEKFTMAELRQAFADAEIEDMAFEDWFDEETSNARAGMDGLEEIEVYSVESSRKGDTFTILETDDLREAVTEARHEAETNPDCEVKILSYLHDIDDENCGNFDADVIEYRCSFEVKRYPANIHVTWFDPYEQEYRWHDISTDGMTDSDLWCADELARDAVQEIYEQMDDFFFIDDEEKELENAFWDIYDNLLV